MHALRQAALRVWRDQTAATIVEYALLLALVMLVVVVAVSALGANASTLLGNASSSIGS